MHGAIEAFQDNQTYIEDMKELTGRPRDFYEALKQNIGQDYMFWLLPTRPVLYIDYWERIYTMDEIYSRKFKEYKKYEYDPQQKLRAIENNASRKDKIYLMIITAVLVSIAALASKSLY